MSNFLVECHNPILFDYLKDFCVFVCSRLGLEDCPPVTFVCKTGSTSFGSYRPSTQAIVVATDGRHVADILRTLAHEIVHDVQYADGEPDCSLEELEYEANGLAGMLMRDYNKMHPELYDAEEEPTPDELDDTGNPGAAMGSLENAGVTVDAYQTPSYESGLDDGQPMRPPYPVELTEGHPDALMMLKLQNKALRAFPSSPKQKAIQKQISDLRTKMKREGTPEYHQTLKETTIQTLAKKHKKSFEYLSAQLKKGSKVECEHTKNDAVARKIALDHLDERPDYYEQLEKMEKKPIKHDIPKIDRHDPIVRHAWMYDNPLGLDWGQFVQQYQRNLKEDAVVNAAGSGQVAGLGVGPQGEPGFPKQKTKLFKRKTFTQFRKKGE